MLGNGVIPKHAQYITLINGMCRVGYIQGAFKLKDEMEALGFGSHEVAESTMVRGLLHCGRTEDAMLVMDHMLVMVRELPTIATFTTPMHRFCRDTEIAEAIKLKGVMELCGLKLDVVDYNVLIMGMCANGDSAAAFELYEEMKHKDLCPYINTCCSC